PPHEGEEVISRTTIALRLDAVVLVPIAITLSTGLTTNVTGFESVFTILVTVDGAPLPWCAVSINDPDVPFGSFNGMTGAGGTVTGQIRGALENITFLINDFGGDLLVSGKSRLTYAVTAARTPLNLITVTATVALTTPEFTLGDPSDRFIGTTTAAPFVGVDARILGLGPLAPGVTNASGVYSGPAGSGTNTALISWTNPRGLARVATRDVL
ncbi:MAG: hypothetical protein ACREF4_18420, partial [Gammaproteobacteria bacterium]